MQHLFKFMLIGLHLVQESHIVGDAFQWPAQVAVFIQHTDQVTGEDLIMFGEIDGVKLLVQYIIQRIHGCERHFTLFLVGVALAVVGIVIVIISHVFVEAGFVIIKILRLLFFILLAVKFFRSFKFFFLGLSLIGVIFLVFEGRIFCDFFIHS